MDDGQRRAQLVGDIGDEVPAHLFQPQQLADVARHQQPVILRIGDQAQVEPHPLVHRGRRVEHGLGIAAGGQPARQGQRLQAFDHRGAEVARMVQAEQVGGRAVEPDRALGVALDHHHRIGQRGGGGAVGAQHVQQAALARAHLDLAAVEQVVQFVPGTGAAGRFPAPPRGQAKQHPAQPPVVPHQHAQGGDRQHPAHLSHRQAEQRGRAEQRGQHRQRAPPRRAQVRRHPIGAGGRVPVARGWRGEAVVHPGSARPASVRWRWRTGSRRRAPSAPCSPPRTAPGSCAGGGCARRSCVPPRTRCRPRRGRAAGRGCRHARDGS